MKGRGTRTWLVLFVAVMLTTGALWPVVARSTRPEARPDDAPLSDLPSLSVNYAAGAPGSYFVFTGQGFTPNAPATISVNGVDLAETVMTDSIGAVHFTLGTTGLNPGSYFVIVRTGLSAGTYFDLDPDAPLRTAAAEPLILVPGAVRPALSIYLPVVMRGYTSILTATPTPTPTSTSTPTPTSTSTSTPTPTSTSTPTPTPSATPTPTRVAGLPGSATIMGQELLGCGGPSSMERNCKA